MQTSSGTNTQNHEDRNTGMEDYEVVIVHGPPQYLRQQTGTSAGRVSANSTWTGTFQTNSTTTGSRSNDVVITIEDACYEGPISPLSEPVSPRIRQYSYHDIEAGVPIAPGDKMDDDDRTVGRKSAASRRPVMPMMMEDHTMTSLTMDDILHEQQPSPTTKRVRLLEEEVLPTGEDQRRASLQGSTVSSLHMSPSSVVAASPNNKNNNNSVSSIPTIATTTTAASSLSDEAFDNDLLHRGVRDAGRWAYGTIFVEVWALTENQTHLTQPSGGWWVDPVFHNQVHEETTDDDDAAATTSCSQCPMCRMTDPTLANYEGPKPVVPGEGLAGALWSEIDRPSSKKHHNAAIVWRDVRALARDPDQPWNARLQIMVNTGIGWAAAVPFFLHGQEGMVLYMARRGVDIKRLRHDTNERYLQTAASLIGSAFALREPRQATVKQRNEELRNTMRRVKAKIRAMGRASLAGQKRSDGGCLFEDLTAPPKSHFGKDGDTVATANTSLETINNNNTIVGETPWWRKTAQNVFWNDNMRQRMHVAYLKSRGGGVRPPPPFNWTQSMYTFCGALVTMVLITTMNSWIVGQFGGDKAVILGLFGALVTLFYGTTAAPSAQPPNVIIGQTVSILIGIAVGAIPGMYIWAKQSLGVALAVAAMVKLGVTHPPAGAAALGFAEGTYTWTTLVAVMIGNVIAISLAALINNLTTERQYPTFWGFQHYSRKVSSTVFGDSTRKAR